MGGELAGGPGIDGPAGLVGGGSRGVHAHGAGEPRCCEGLGQHQLGHRGPADVSGADRDDPVLARQ